MAAVHPRKAGVSDGQSSPNCVIHEVSAPPDPMQLPQATKARPPPRALRDMLSMIALSIVIIIGCAFTIVSLRAKNVRLERELRMAEQRAIDDLYLIEKLTELATSCDDKLYMMEKLESSSSSSSSGTQQAPKRAPSSAGQGVSPCGWSRGASYHSYRSWQGERTEQDDGCPDLDDESDDATLRRSSSTALTSYCEQRGSCTTWLTSGVRLQSDCCLQATDELDSEEEIEVIDMDAI